MIELVEGLVRAGTPTLANRVHSLVSTIFTFGMDAALIEANPCHRLRKRGVETAGRRVLLLSDPTRRHAHAIASQWLPVFWSLSWFEAQPGTSSVLCDPTHPALASFPTDFHSDYQWRELAKPP